MLMPDYRDFTSLNVLSFRRGTKQFLFLFFSFASVVYPFLKLQMSKVTKSAFKRSELAGRTMAGPVILKWNRLFLRVFDEKRFVRACCLGFDWSGWIALIKSEILITTGMALPVGSDKWKAPLVSQNGQYYQNAQISSFHLKLFDFRKYPTVATSTTYMVWILSRLHD